MVFDTTGTSPKYCTSVHYTISELPPPLYSTSMVSSMVEVGKVRDIRLGRHGGQQAFR